MAKHDDFDDEFDKHFENISGTIKTGFIVTMIMSVLGGLVSLGVIGTILYLLVKNFG